jgi:hypothetical protein
MERTIYFQKLVIAGDVEEVGASPCMHVLEDNNIFSRWGVKRGRLHRGLMCG